MDRKARRSRSVTPKKCVKNPVRSQSGTPRTVKLRNLSGHSPQSNKMEPKASTSPCTPCSVMLKPLTIAQMGETSGNTPYARKHIKDRKTNSQENITTPKVNMEFSMELKKVINERNILTSKTRKRVFEALDEIKSSSEEVSRKFKREKALLEIVNSELKYVKQLETILNFFMTPIKQQKLLKSDDFEVLFGNINAIYNINKELLEELDKGTDNIANAFSKIAPFLKLYSVYACEFKNTLHLLQSSRTVNPQFSKFVESQESRPEVQNKLSALLITPIQRVPRYKLLLTQLYELTPPTEDDYPQLLGCLEKIEDAAEHINKVVEEQENMQRLLELQRCLRCGEPNVITPGRKLKKEGILMRVTNKSHSERVYTVLMSDIIMFNKMKKHEPKINSLKCMFIFPLNKCKVFEILDKGSFRILCENEEIVLYHEQFSETKKWIKKLKNAIQNYLDDRKTLRKDSSSRRPVKRKDMLEYHEVGLSPGQPLKKRKIVVESTDILKETSTHDFKVSKRRNIHSLNGCRFDDKRNVAQVLFKPEPVPEPLENNIETPVKRPQGMSQEVYVFGQPHNRPSMFKFGNIFGGVGSTIKRFFGFRN